MGLTEQSDTRGGVARPCPSRLAIGAAESAGTGDWLPRVPHGLARDRCGRVALDPVPPSGHFAISQAKIR